MPPVLQETRSKVVKLEIEKEALKKETDQKSKSRVKDIEKEWNICIPFNKADLKVYSYHLYIIRL